MDKLTPPFFTLQDFSLRENHLAGYPSLLSQEHNYDKRANKRRVFEW